MAPPWTRPKGIANSNDNKIAISPSYSASEEDLSDPDALPPHPLVPEDPWERVQKAVIKEGDWQIVSKFTVVPVCCRRREINLRWEPMTYREIKELYS